jgi:L-threonylcarbamoyladenylate synthase
MPNHPLAIEVIAKAGGAIACTSANKSGQRPARDAAEVADAIGSELDLILDGGVAPGGVPSTVVEFRDGEMIVHRDGAIPGDHIRETWRALLAAHEPV